MPHSGSFGLLLTVHVVVGVFVIGPLTLITVVTPRLLRLGAGALPILRLCVRMIRALTLASLLIVVTGLGLVNQGSFGSVRSLGDPWLSGALVLWVVATGISLGIIAPGLAHAVKEIDAGGDTHRRTLPIMGGVAVSTACWVLIIASMAIKPGT
ncbi:hypothetical protein [Frankia sp. CcWB3]